MQKDEMDAIDNALMNSHFDTTSNINKQVILMVDTVLMKIVGLTLLVYDSMERLR
jgi:hypothetical protein